MVVFSRKIGERVRIGPDVEIAIVQVRGNSVRLGVTAPREIPVHCTEVREQMQETHPARSTPPEIPHEAVPRKQV